MDKNTITGLLLIALLFLGFIWLSPKPEQTAQSTGNEASQDVQNAQNATLDSLSADDLSWLKKNIAEHGTVSTTDSVKTSTLTSNNYNLTLSGDKISGTLTLRDKTTINIDDIISRNTQATTTAQYNEAVELLKSSITSLGKYGKFAQFLSGKNEIVKLENEVLALELSSKAGTISRAELKQYDSEYNADENDNTKHKVVLFENGSNKLNFLINVPQQLNTDDFYFKPQVINDSTVNMILPLSDNAYWGLQYILPKGENYTVKINIIQKNLDRLLASNNPTIGIDWNQKIKRQEKGFMFEERNSGLFYKFAGGDVENLKETGDDSEERQSKVKWIGFKNQFFSSVLIARKSFDMVDFDSQSIARGSNYLKKVNASAEMNDYDWSSANPISFDLFLGPNLYPLLSSMDEKITTDEDLDMTRLIPLGWWIFRYINTWIIIPIFNLLGSSIASYGIIILILTLFIKLILFPLTYKSYTSRAKMRILAPDIKAINDKYPGNENAMVRQQKTMELYNRAGASPFSGCLPMLLQMPILFAMFTFFPSCIELRGQSFLWAHDLSAPDAIISWSGNIPLITEYFGNHISLFCLLMTATNIIYTYTTMQSQSNGMPGMKWMMYLMPVFFMIFFNNYASGLSYYYFLSLLITIIQTFAIRHTVKEADVRRVMAENAKKPRKKSGFMARLEEAQRQQQAALKAQQQRNNNGKGRR